MAFSTAAGYGNLPNGNFSPVIYSKQVQLAFRKSSIVESITNNDYFGEIAQMGDSVKIIKEPEITVKDYARGTTITHKISMTRIFLSQLTKQTTLLSKLMTLKKHILMSTLCKWLQIVPVIACVISMTKKSLATCQVSNSLQFMAHLMPLTQLLMGTKLFRLHLVVQT